MAPAAHIPYAYGGAGQRPCIRGSTDDGNDARLQGHEPSSRVSVLERARARCAAQTADEQYLPREGQSGWV